MAYHLARMRQSRFTPPGTASPARRRLTTGPRACSAGLAASIFLLAGAVFAWSPALARRQRGRAPRNSLGMTAPSLFAHLAVFVVAIVLSGCSLPDPWSRGYARSQSQSERVYAVPTAEQIDAIGRLLTTMHGLGLALDDVTPAKLLMPAITTERLASAATSTTPPKPADPATAHSNGAGASSGGGSTDDQALSGLSSSAYWWGGVMIAIGIGSLIARLWLPVIPITASVYLLAGGAALMVFPVLVDRYLGYAVAGCAVAGGLYLYGWWDNRKKLLAPPPPEPTP